MEVKQLPHMIILDFDDVAPEFSYGPVYYDSIHRELITSVEYLKTLYPDNEWVQHLWI